MGVGHIILRLVVFLLSLPFAYLAALVPCSFLKVAAENAGFPSWVIVYPVGAIIMICFCCYFQSAITPPETPEDYREIAKSKRYSRFSPASFLVGRWFSKH